MTTFALVHGAWHGAWCWESVAPLLREAAHDVVRLQSAHPFTAPFPLPELSRVRCTSVVCTDDRMVYPEWSRRIAGEIGADVVELPGSHSPELSRPAAVAEVLLSVAGGR